MKCEQQQNTIDEKRYIVDRHIFSYFARVCKTFDMIRLKKKKKILKAYTQTQPHIHTNGNKQSKTMENKTKDALIDTKQTEGMKRKQKIQKAQESKQQLTNKQEISERQQAVERKAR